MGSKYGQDFQRNGSRTKHRRRSQLSRGGGRAAAVGQALAALKPLSVTVIPRSCRGTGVLHSSGSASADYPQYSEGISWPRRLFCC